MRNSELVLMYSYSQNYIVQLSSYAQHWNWSLYEQDMSTSALASSQVKYVYQGTDFSKIYLPVKRFFISDEMPTIAQASSGVKYRYQRFGFLRAIP